MKIRIRPDGITEKLEGNNKNLEPGSEHEVIPAPDDKSNEGGVWVKGVHEPVKVLTDEYEEVAETEPAAEEKTEEKGFEGTRTLTAYNVRTKEKGVPVQNAVIKKTAKGAFMVQGDDGAGNKLTTLVNSEKALAAIASGEAKQGW